VGHVQQVVKTRQVRAPVSPAGGAAVGRGQGPEDAYNGHTVSRLAAVNQVRLQHNLNCKAQSRTAQHGPRC
jgi:hypothetical protein